MNLIAAAESIDNVRQFIEGTGLHETLEVLADTEFEAARVALRKRKSAVDAKQQVWSAVNHLETAHVAFFKGCQSNGRKIFAATRWHHACEMDVITLCLMALCYKYLDEEKLMIDALEQARKTYNHHTDQGPWVAVFQALCSTYNPVVQIDVWKEELELGPKVPDVSLPDFYRRMTNREW